MHDGQTVYNFRLMSNALQPLIMQDPPIEGYMDIATVRVIASDDRAAVALLRNEFPKHRWDILSSTREVLRPKAVRFNVQED